MGSSSSLQKVTIISLISVIICSVSTIAANTLGGSPDSNQNSQYAGSEVGIALQGILNNIGSAGSKSSGALNGVVVAAPSDNPNYKYTWIRDSSLVYKVLIDTYISGKKPSLLNGIYAWIESQGRLQNVSNPSGYARAGGLGEPKFELNETAFTGSWGRPQRDGPALRAHTIIKFGNYLLDKKASSYVKNTIWPIVQLDLDYVRDFWNQTGFDLWEEQSGSSFFTSAAQHRALRVGSAFAKRLGYTTAATQYADQADNVLCFLQAYWSSTHSYIVSNINLQSSRTGLDANSILTSIHNFDLHAGCDAATFQPCSDKALANHLAVVDSFRSIYLINANASTATAVAIGRYSEDVYQGGNPWYLAVFAASEQLYYAIAQWQTAGELTVTSVSLPFFQRLVTGVKVGKYNKHSHQFNMITTAVKTYAEGFIAINQKYTPKDGSLSEQFSRATGVPLSAPDLTWSYASAVTAFNARSGDLPPSWGAKGLPVPTVCLPRPVANVSVTFNLNSSYSSAYVVGSIIELGTWNTNNAIQLASSGSNRWTVTIPIARDTGFEYKYIYKTNGVVTWESDPNNNAITPSTGNFTLNDIWR